LVRQLLTETGLLSALGGALGLLLALWGKDVLVAIFPKEIANLSIPIVDQIPMDWRVFGFMTLVTVVSGLMVGVAPALQATGSDVNEALKESPRDDGIPQARRRAHGVLVAVQTATALVLLSG